MDAKFKIEGIAELNKKLDELSNQFAVKVIRTSVVQATTPAIQKMKLAVPVGSKAHKTYKGRWVAPGFLKKSIKRKSYVDKVTGRVGVVIGVAQEAFYGVVFLDRSGGYNLKRKRQGEAKYRRKTARTVGHVSGRPWFESSFTSTTQTMLERFKVRMAASIEKLKSK